MKINFVYRIGGAFPWSMGEGFVLALRELGHIVNPYAAEKDSYKQKPFSKKFLEFLKQPCDILFVMGADKYFDLYMDGEIKDYVKNLKIPKLVFFMESMKSRTRTFDKCSKTMSLWTHIATCDETEIEWIKGLGCPNVVYAPGWVDEATFNPRDLPYEHDFQFIGFAHKHRVPTILHFNQHLHMHFGRYPTLEEYVQAINQTKIPIAINSVFKGFTQRVTETLSCGKLLLHPALPEEFKISKELFKDREHIVYYDSLEHGVELGKYYLEHEDERKLIEAKARQVILRSHTTKIRAKEFIEFVVSTP